MRIIRKGAVALIKRKRKAGSLPGLRMLQGNAYQKHWQRGQQSAASWPWARLAAGLLLLSLFSCNPSSEDSGESAGQAADGVSRASEAFEDIVLTNSPRPGAPIHFQATPGDGRVTLSWHNPPYCRYERLCAETPHSYHLQYRLSPAVEEGESPSAEPGEAEGEPQPAVPQEAAEEGEWITVEGITYSDPEDPDSDVIVEGLTNDQSYDFRIALVLEASLPPLSTSDEQDGTEQDETEQTEQAEAGAEQSEAEGEIEMEEIPEEERQGAYATLAVVPSPLTRPPSAPRQLQAKALSPTRIALVWKIPGSNGGEAVSGYAIQYSAASADFVDLEQGEQLAETSFTHEGLEHEQEYRYRVAALNGKGRGLYSEEATATTLDGTPPLLAVAEEQASLTPLSTLIKIETDEAVSIDWLLLPADAPPPASIEQIRNGKDGEGSQALPYQAEYQHGSLEISEVSEAAQGQAAFAAHLELQRLTDDSSYSAHFVATDATGNQAVASIDLRTSALPIFSTSPASPVAYEGQSGGELIATIAGLPGLSLADVTRYEILTGEHLSSAYDMDQPARFTIDADGNIHLTGLSFDADNRDRYLLLIEAHTVTGNWQGKVAIKTSGHNGLIGIHTLEQLNAIRYISKKDRRPRFDRAVGFVGSGCGRMLEACRGFELMRDLDFRSPDSYASGEVKQAWISGQGWKPLPRYKATSAVGTCFYSFQDSCIKALPRVTATFDGRGHTISNLYINRPGTNRKPEGGSQKEETVIGYSRYSSSSEYVGLFKEITGVVRRLGLINVDVRGGKYVGGLAGCISDSSGQVTSSYVTGRVQGTSGVGGFSGCGIFGNQEPAHISASYAAVAVGGLRHVGGFMGALDNAKIQSSYASGSVRGRTRSGGFLGSKGDNRESFHSIHDTYSTGWAAVGNLKPGGKKYGYVGGCSVGIGNTHIPVHNSYWDMDTSGHQERNCNLGNAVGQGSLQLQLPRGYSDIYSEWNRDLDADLAYGIDDSSQMGDWLPDDPWDFGESNEYPALKVDFNGDGIATWQEFGYQLRQQPILALPSLNSNGDIELAWSSPSVGYWEPSPQLSYTIYRDGIILGGHDTTDHSLEYSNPAFAIGPKDYIHGRRYGVPEGAAVGIVEPHYTDTTVEPGERYSYQVVAVVNGGEATRSAIISCTLLDEAPPHLECSAGP